MTLGQSADGLGWMGSHKMDPWTTLTYSNISVYSVTDKTQIIGEFNVVGACPKELTVMGSG